MDLNYLYQRRQIEQFRAERAACPQSQKAHRGMAQLYDLLIEQDRIQRQDETS